MAKKKKEKWRLNPDEVNWTGMSMSSGRRKHATRSGRASSITGAEYVLIHTPSQISVSGNVPKGNYSRSEMRKKQDRLFRELFSELEIKVAKFLKIPGR